MTFRVGRNFETAVECSTAVQARQQALTFKTEYFTVWKLGYGHWKIVLDLSVPVKSRFSFEELVERCIQ